MWSQQSYTEEKPLQHAGLSTKLPEPESEVLDHHQWLFTQTYIYHSVNFFANINLVYLFGLSGAVKTQKRQFAKKLASTEKIGVKAYGSLCFHNEIKIAGSKGSKTPLIIISLKTRKKKYKQKTM